MRPAILLVVLLSSAALAVPPVPASVTFAGTTTLHATGTAHAVLELPVSSDLLKVEFLARPAGASYGLVLKQTRPIYVYEDDGFQYPTLHLRDYPWPIAGGTWHAYVIGPPGTDTTVRLTLDLPGAVDVAAEPWSQGTAKRLTSAFAEAGAPLPEPADRYLAVDRAAVDFATPGYVVTFHQVEWALSVGAGVTIMVNCVDHDSELPDCDYTQFAVGGLTAGGTLEAAHWFSVPPGSAEVTTTYATVGGTVVLWHRVGILAVELAPDNVAAGGVEDPPEPGIPGVGTR